VPADVASREGAGVLDVDLAVAAASSGLGALELRPAPEQSRLRAARDSIWADASRSLSMLLWLRDAGGAVFDAGVERVSVEVGGGELRSPVERIAPGLYQLSVAVLPALPASLQVDVSFDAEPFVSLVLPVEGGGARPRRDEGGCALHAADAPSRRGRAVAGAATVLLALLLGVFRSRSGKP
jgi:hypothetical protein